MSYQLVEDLQKKACPQVAVSQSCRVLEVSRSGYYAHQAAHRKRLAEPTLCAQSVHLKAAFAASQKAYGSRRLRTAMAERGLAMGRHRIRTLMRLNGLRPVWRRKFVHTTDSKHTMAVSPNVLNRQFEQALPNQVWVADITYIRTKSGWLYLAAVLDLHSRKTSGLGDGQCHACWLGMRGLADGHHSKKSSTWSDRAFRPGHAIRQQRASRLTCQTWLGRQHEPQGQLLGQRGHGALLLESEDGAGLAPGLCQSRRGHKRYC